MASLGRKIKAAKEAAKDKDDDRKTSWADMSSASNECPFCGVKYSKMSLKQINGHLKGFWGGRQRECPSV